MNTQRTLTPIALVLLAMIVALPSQAQPFIENVPAEAAIYVGWRGSSDMGPDYEGSNMQGIVEQTGMLQAIPELIAIFQEVGQDDEFDPEVGQLLNMGGTLWSALWQNGGAMYMLPPEENGPPIPRLAILWGKGENDQALRQSLTDIAEMMNEAEQVAVFTGEVGDALYLSFAFNAANVPANTLAQSPSFTQAVGQVQGDGALLVYVDVQEWIAQVDQVAAMMQEGAEQRGRQDPFAELWPRMREISGLGGVNRLMMSAGIEDRNWHTQLYLDAPAPRRGILSLVDNQPIEPSSLAHVPSTATYLQVFTMDPARVLDVTREMLGGIDPDLVDQMDEGLAWASEEVGVGFEADLIRGMGPVWSVYIDPMVAGNGFTSLVLVNELRDADAVEAALAQLVTSANEALLQGQQRSPFNVQMLTEEIDGVTITHMGIPYIAPSYMVHNGRLYVSMFPQALELALEQSGEVQDSILSNEAFQQTMARFQARPYTGLSFTDLPETAADGYGFNLIIMQTIAGAGEMFSGRVSPLRMPPIGRVLPFVEPAGAQTWVGDDGLHMHSIEPFPGSAMLGPAKGAESMMAVSGPLAVAIILPALGQARGAAMDAQAMAQGRMVSMGAMSFAVDHKGDMPSDIAQIYTDGYLPDAEVFLVPLGAVDELPRNFDQWEEARAAQFIRENSAFVLVPGLSIDVDQNTNILLFQNPDAAEDDQVIVCWLDGSVGRMDVDGLAEQLQAQTGSSIDQLIERQQVVRP